MNYRIVQTFLNHRSESNGPFWLLNPKVTGSVTIGILQFYLTRLNDCSRGEQNYLNVFQLQGEIEGKIGI